MSRWGRSFERMGIGPNGPSFDLRKRIKDYLLILQCETRSRCHTGVMLLMRRASEEEHKGREAGRIKINALTEMLMKAQGAIS